LHELVRGTGGEVAEEATVKPWELPAWVRTQAARMGLRLDSAASRALVAQVGERQQRLLRELEKLALEVGDGATLSAEQIEARAARSAERRVFALADAVVGGDASSATASFLRLRAQGERLGGMSYWICQRLRLACEVAARLERGEPAAEIKRGLRMPSRAADRLIADVARSDPDRLRRALEAMADLELGSRGGAVVGGGRGSLTGGEWRAALDEDTQALLAIDEISGAAQSG
jgi:DNA polymerase-3 subunit delta